MRQKQAAISRIFCFLLYQELGVSRCGQSPRGQPRPHKLSCNGQQRASAPRHTSTTAVPNGSHPIGHGLDFARRPQPKPGTSVPPGQHQGPGLVTPRGAHSRARCAGHNDFNTGEAIPQRTSLMPSREQPSCALDGPRGWGIFSGVWLCLIREQDW